MAWLDLSGTVQNSSKTFLDARVQRIAETTSVAMLALLSLLDLVYMLRSTLAATLLKIIALPVPLLRQVYVAALESEQTRCF